LRSEELTRRSVVGADAADVELGFRPRRGVLEGDDRFRRGHVDRGEVDVGLLGVAGGAQLVDHVVDLLVVHADFLLVRRDLEPPAGGGLVKM